MSHQKTIIKELLLALLPYTEANMALVYKPAQFFNELEKKTNTNRNTLAATMSRAKKNKLLRINEEGIPQLTWRGKSKINSCLADKLKKQKLVVIFDIPETQSAKRYELRSYLYSQRFKYVQRSVWASDYNVTNELLELVAELRLGKYVQIIIGETIYP